MQSGPLLKLGLRQQLALTPQLQQSIRLLSLSAQDLEAEIAQAILDNPLLEQQEQYDTEPVSQEYPTQEQETQYPVPQEEAGYPNIEEAVAYPIPEEPRYWSVSEFSSYRGVRDSNDDFGMVEGSAAETLSQYLQSQLHLTRATPRDSLLVEILISELDENGYLSTEAQHLAGAFPEIQADGDEWRGALRLLQSFDPIGVGARSLSKCLLLQLAQREGTSSPGDVAVCANRIARDHLDLLATGNAKRLCDVLGCSPRTFRAAHALLLELDPRPGRAWANSVADYVVPDVLVRKIQEQWKVFLNPAIAPRLRVNPVYERLLDASPAAESRLLRAQTQQAHGLIKSINQRCSTVLRVMQAIVGHQQAFFEQGMQAMRPLLLRDIASELTMHESTVSRATRQKFAQTPWGVVEIKRFFGTALATDDGQTTSGEAVRSLILKLVSQESAKKPLSDSQIAVRLALEGIKVARRTVAKYREAAGIESAIVRKARASLVEAKHEIPVK